MFWSGGRPGQFIHMKVFRALMVPGGGFCEGIILQGIHIPSGLPVIGQSFLRIKGYVTGACVHVTIQRNSTYIQTFRRSIYDTRQSKYPHLPIRRYELFPPGICFAAPLHPRCFQPLYPTTVRSGIRQRKTTSHPDRHRGRSNDYYATPPLPIISFNHRASGYASVLSHAAASDEDPPPKLRRFVASRLWKWHF